AMPPLRSVACPRIAASASLNDGLPRVCPCGNQIFVTQLPFRSCANPCHRLALGEEWSSRDGRKRRSVFDWFAARRRRRGRGEPKALAEQPIAATGTIV